MAENNGYASDGIRWDDKIVNPNEEGSRYNYDELKELAAKNNGYKYNNINLDYLSYNDNVANKWLPESLQADSYLKFFELTRLIQQYNYKNKYLPTAHKKNYLPIPFNIKIDEDTGNIKVTKNNGKIEVYDKNESGHREDGEYIFFSKEGDKSSQTIYDLYLVGSSFQVQQQYIDTLGNEQVRTHKYSINQANVIFLTIWSGGGGGAGNIVGKYSGGGGGGAVATIAIDISKLIDYNEHSLQIIFTSDTGKGGTNGNDGKAGATASIYYRYKSDSSKDQYITENLAKVWGGRGGMSYHPDYDYGYGGNGGSVVLTSDNLKKYSFIKIISSANGGQGGSKEYGAVVRKKYNFNIIENAEGNTAAFSINTGSVYSQEDHKNGAGGGGLGKGGIYGTKDEEYGKPGQWGAGGGGAYGKTAGQCHGGDGGECGFIITW